MFKTLWAYIKGIQEPTEMAQTETIGATNYVELDYDSSVK